MKSMKRQYSSLYSDMTVDILNTDSNVEYNKKQNKSEIATPRKPFD